MRSATGQRHRRPGRIGFVVLAVVTLMSSAPQAWAHDVLISSSPAAGAVLAQAPTSVTLVFDQGVQNAYAEMAITVGSQPPVEFTPQIDGVQVTAQLAAEHLTIPAQTSGQTAWRIGYRIVSADGHPVSGLVDFWVGGAGDTDHAGAGTPDRGDPTSHGLLWLLILGAAAVIAVAVAAGLIVRRRRIDPA